MPAQKGNKTAEKKVDDLIIIIPKYIEHISEGFSKESFIDCDYRTIEKHLLENDVLQTLKKELERAERIGRKYWEEIGRDITTGIKKGNPATWIFTMKNKYPDSWKDKTEHEHSGKVVIDFTND